MAQQGAVRTILEVITMHETPIRTVAQQNADERTLFYCGPGIGLCGKCGDLALGVEARHDAVPGSPREVGCHVQWLYESIMTGTNIEYCNGGRVYRDWHYACVPEFKPGQFQTARAWIMANQA